MNPVVCGATGKTLTEWRERTFVQRYINGKKEILPLYLDVKHIIELHKQSETYIAKQAVKAVEADIEEDEVKTTAEPEEVDNVIEASEIMAEQAPL